MKLEVYDAEPANWSATSRRGKRLRLESRVVVDAANPPRVPPAASAAFGGRVRPACPAGDVHDQAHEGHGDIHDAARPRSRIPGTHTQAERQAALDPGTEIKGTLGDMTFAVERMNACVRRWMTAREIAGVRRGNEAAPRRLGGRGRDAEEKLSRPKRAG